MGLLTCARVSWLTSLLTARRSVALCLVVWRGMRRTQQDRTRLVCRAAAAAAAEASPPPSSHLSACRSATAWNCTIECRLCTASCTSFTQRLMISELFCCGCGGEAVVVRRWWCGW
jgi:hypothetical protein